MAVLGIVIVVLAIRLAMNPAKIGEFKSTEVSGSDQLADRIDPNTATEAELAAIPELGEKRATAIVEFREKFHSRHPSELAFQKVSDLEQISGIGAATAENMEPYLMFPDGNAGDHSAIIPSTR
jgi:competence ComEA-like helix-hairpin-helix protein